LTNRAWIHFERHTVKEHMQRLAEKAPRARENHDDDDVVTGPSRDNDSEARSDCSANTIEHCVTSSLLHAEELVEVVYLQCLVEIPS
jgi:hypothetical protein